MPVSQRLAIWGAGGHAKVVADVARSTGWEILAFLDDDATKQGHNFYGAPVQPPEIVGIRRSPSDHSLSDFIPIVVAIGDNATRERCLDSLITRGVPVPVLIDPSARVSPTAVLGPGTVVMAGAVVQADSRIGIGGLVNTGASVDHDCILGACVHVAPGARLTGQVTVGDRTLVGAGAVVTPLVQIAADNTIGAGAVVVRSTLPGQVLAGVPARVLREA